MKRLLKWLSVVLVSSLFHACNSSYILSVEKAALVRPLIEKHKTILVVGIINDSTENLRRAVEMSIVNKLEKLGYNARSALANYGAGGLAELGEEQTYVKLCNDGIDVVFTVSLLDRALDGHHKRDMAPGYFASYYYHRIWNYEKIEADLRTYDQTPDAHYFWECILFDLGTLEAKCIVQTRSFNTMELRNNSEEYINRIIRRMINEKVLKR